MPLMVGTFSRLDANAEQGEVTAAALIPHRLSLHFYYVLSGISQGVAF